MDIFFKYFFYLTLFSLLSVFGWYTEFAIVEDYGYFYSLLGVIVFILFILSAVFFALLDVFFCSSRQLGKGSTQFSRNFEKVHRILALRLPAFGNKKTRATH